MLHNRAPPKTYRERVALFRARVTRRNPNALRPPWPFSQISDAEQTRFDGRCNRRAAFLSLDGAAEGRRAYIAGESSALEYARQTLRWSRDAQERWIRLGGGLP